MTFEFGPTNPFEISTKAEKILLPVASLTTNSLSGKLTLEVAPTITWDEESGEIRIRDGHRAVDNRGKALEPAVYVARILRLKAGHFVFEKPSNGPEPRDITMQFHRANDITWPEPHIEVDGLPEWASQTLTMTKHLDRWPNVSTIKVTLHGGQDTRLLPMERLTTFRENANQAVPTRITSARVSPAAQPTTPSSVADASSFVHISGPPPPWNESSPAISSQSIPAYKASTNWRSSAGGSSGLPARQQVAGSSTNVCLPRQSRGNRVDKEVDRTSQVLTNDSITGDNGILAQAIKVGREGLEGHTRFYEENLWAIVMGGTPGTEEDLMGMGGGASKYER